ncbi:MAG: aspartate/glutamate racemase family protein [Chloroflexota bacterium]
MRICFVNITIEEVSGPYFDLLRQLFARVVRTDAAVDIKSVKPGIRKAFEGSNPYFILLDKREIVEQVIAAEKEGYDAAVVGCFLDPGVAEARSVVSIPVVGPGEATIHYACLLGNRFGIVTLDDRQLIASEETMLRQHGLESRTIPRPVRPISLPSYEVFTRGLKEPRIVASAVLEQAKHCVADGAEVVVVGCAGLGPECTLAGVSKVPEGEAPILDCITIALKTAEVMVDLRAVIGLPPSSRVGLYRSPTSKALHDVRRSFGLEPH